MNEDVVVTDDATGLEIDIIHKRRIAVQVHVGEAADGDVLVRLVTVTVVLKVLVPGSQTDRLKAGRDGIES